MRVGGVSVELLILALHHFNFVRDVFVGLAGGHSWRLPLNHRHMIVSATCDVSRVQVNFVDFLVARGLVRLRVQV